jgi:predicted transcriptional regulator
MASDWDDELRAKVIKMYEAAKPTPENSTEIVAEIAEEIGKTTNGVRMIISKAGKYIKKADATAGKSGNGDKPASTRVNKADAINALSEAIAAQEIEVDEEILGKLTGKAAVYFTKVVNDLVTNAE